MYSIDCNKLGSGKKTCFNCRHMIALRSMAKDRQIVKSGMVASLPIQTDVDKNKGCKDTMFNILNALSIFPLLGLLMGVES